METILAFEICKEKGFKYIFTSKNIKEDRN